MFKNLARDCRGLTEEALTAVFKEVDDAVQSELIAAGILRADGSYNPLHCARWPWKRKGPNGYYKEVPTEIFASKYRWTFERAWYYYIATGSGIPPDKAEEFHKQWGTQVRVDGHCGCPSPLEWEKGFAVGAYHIDTQEGLNAFVQLLASIYTGDPKVYE